MALVLTLATSLVPDLLRLPPPGSRWILWKESLLLWFPSFRLHCLPISNPRTPLHPGPTPSLLPCLPPSFCPLLLSFLFPFPRGSMSVSLSLGLFGFLSLWIPASSFLPLCLPASRLPSLLPPFHPPSFLLARAPCLPGSSSYSSASPFSAVRASHLPVGPSPHLLNLVGEGPSGSRHRP